MPVLFIVLIVAFAVLSIGYVWQNGFATETVDVIYPVIGAIFLSAYLGYKAIWLDNPPPKTFGVSIGVLADRINGTISTMSHLRVNDSLGPSMGAMMIDLTIQDPAFGSLNLPQGLRDASGDSTSAPYITHVRDILEYGLLRWFSQAQDVRMGYQGGYIVTLVNSGGGTGGPIAMDLVQVDTSLGASEPNPLLKASPVHIALPKGSRVLRSANNRYTIEIRTPHTALRFRFTGINAEPLRKAATRDGERIYAALRLPNPPPPGLVMYAFRVDFEATQTPYSRHSNDAKRETRWIAAVEQALDRDFSWERLRSKLLTR